MKAPGLGRWSRAGVLRHLSRIAKYQPPLRCHRTAVGRRPRSVRRRAARLQIFPACRCCPLVVLTRLRVWRLMETLVEVGSGRCGLIWVVRAEDAGTRIGCEDPGTARCLGRGGTAAACCSVHLKEWLEAWTTGKATTAGRLAREGPARKELDAAWRTWVLCAGPSTHYSNDIKKFSTKKSL